MVVNIVEGAMGRHKAPCRRGGILSKSDLTSHVKSDGKVSRGLSPPPINVPSLGIPKLSATLHSECSQTLFHLKKFGVFLNFLTYSGRMWGVGVLTRTHEVDSTY